MRQTKFRRSSRARRTRADARRPSVIHQLLLDPLESRLLLSTTLWPRVPAKPDMAQPQLVANVLSATPGAAGTTSPIGLTPAQMRGAYGLGQYGASNINFDGIGAYGQGQTIAIVDAYNDPTIFADANAFSAQFGLPQFSAAGGSAPTLTVLNQSGQTTDLPTTDPSGPYDTTGTIDWEMEESLDVEWAHVMAPDANIVLVEANDDTDSNLFTAVQTAAGITGVVTVSMSWGDTENDIGRNAERADDATFVTPSGHIGGSGLAGGVTFVAATGDSGAPGIYPAYSPNVVAAGGTTLTVSGDSYVSESGWSDSGGGISRTESQPSYQVGEVNGLSTTRRTIPDVSIDADPNSGVPLYDSYDLGASTPWFNGTIGGTSLASPMWAALITVADQGRASLGLGSLNGASQTLPMLYSLPSTDFHDITTGNNGYAAGPGYDLVTGIGSPIANLLIPGLVGSAGVSQQLSFAQPPTTQAAGVAFSPVITVDVDDLYGNIVTSDTSTVTLAVATGPGSLSGTTSVAAVNGVATFTGVSLSPAGVYTLIATDGSLVSATSSSVTITAVAAPVVVADNGFEVPALAADSFQYNPAGSSWTFTPGSGSYNSGISANDSGFTFDNPNAPQGSQVGILQANSAISQVIPGWAAGNYTLTLYAAQRGIYNNGGQNFQVLIDGVVVATIDPTTTTYQAYTTSVFAVTAGSHTLTFKGLDSAGGDNTAFLDNVSIASAASFVPPTLTNISVSTPQNIPLTFTAANFTAAFTDTNPGGTLQDVKITSLPTNGTLALSGVAVTVNQVIPIAQIGNLVYTPASGYMGADSFGWNGADQVSYAVTPALVNLTVTASTGVPTVADGGFETPALTAGTFQYNPAGSGWTFTAGSGSYNSGISTNDSPFTFDNPNAPQGSQVGILQGNSAISQVIPGWAAGNYTLTLYAAQRGVYNNGGQNFEILIDGTVVATINPTTTTYQAYTTSVFAVTAGTHTLTIKGLDSAGGDNTAFLDNVSIASAASFVPPTLTNISLSTPQNVPLTFAAFDFTSAFSDPNPGGTLQAVEITSLPTNGTLTLSSVAVTVNQVIPIAQIANLVYTPANSYTGADSFGWNGTDQVGYAAAPALVNLTVTLSAGAPTIADSGFETPVLSAGTFQYNPAGSGWTFTAGSGSYNSGISTNDSPFTFDNPNAPQGSQVAILQGNSSISQVISGWEAGNYTLTLSAAQRGIYNNGGQNFEILIDGVVVATIDPTTTTYQNYTTLAFAVTAGTHTLTIKGLDSAGGDNTAFIDNISLATSP